MASATSDRPNDMPELAANPRKVYAALKAAGRPLTAYQLIDALRGEGMSAPPTVYRALNRLMEAGLAHRIESVNAYVACAAVHAHVGPGAGSVVFTVCDSCGRADEVVDNTLGADLSRYANAKDFTVDRATLELHGRCGACRTPPEPSAGSESLSP